MAEQFKLSIGSTGYCVFKGEIHRFRIISRFHKETADKAVNVYQLCGDTISADKVYCEEDALFDNPNDVITRLVVDAEKKHIQFKK